MESIAGLTCTGRQLLGPASDLVEVENDNGLCHTAIVYHKEYRQHSAITDALGVVLGFLESPLVTGLVELVGRDAEAGALIYPTGPVWSLAEVIRIMSDGGKAGGVRAGLELMYTSGQILVEGAEAGASQGVYSHGGLTPRRIMVKQDGQVMVIGYAVPQVDILHFHESGGHLPREDSFRYCPPERMEARQEDLSSDLFGLALAGFELMTGKPVYDGLVNDIRQQAARGEGSRRLFRFREVLPDGVRDLLIRALKPEPQSRFGSGEEFLDAIHELLSRGKSEGPPLIELMEDVAHERRRMGQQMEAGKTVMVEQDELADSLAEAPKSDVSGSSRGRAWTPGRRRTVRRSAGGGLENLLRASRTADPQDVPEEDLAAAEDVAPAATAGPVPDRSGLRESSRWSKVDRSINRRTPRRSRKADPEPEPIEPIVASSHRSAVPPPPSVPIFDDEADVSPSEAAPSVEADAASTDDADELLARIRGRSGSRSAKEDEPPEAAPRPIIEDPAPLLMPTPSSHGSEAATVMMSHRQLREAVAEALEDDNESVILLGTVSVDNVAVDEEPRVAIQSNQQARQREYRVQVDPGTDPCSVKLPGKISAAEAVSWLIGNVLPVPLDATGRLLGWYRLEQGGQRLDPQSKMSAVDADEPLQLSFVANTTIDVQVEVVRGGSAVRFNSDVGTAVPVVSLVGHLAGWLGLDGAWGLFQGDDQLLPHQLLSDVSVTDGAALQLRPIDRGDSDRKDGG
jgi:hypothetical protein